jgi:hypothetical protein
MMTEGHAAANEAQLRKRQPWLDRLHCRDVGSVPRKADEQSSQLPPRAAEQAGIRAADCRAG